MQEPTAALETKAKHTPAFGGHGGLTAAPPAPKQERVFGRDRPRNVGVLFLPRSQPRLAGAA